MTVRLGLNEDIAPDFPQICQINARISIGQEPGSEGEV